METEWNKLKMLSWYQAKASHCILHLIYQIFINYIVWSFTWDVKVSKAVSRRAGDDVAAPPHTLNVPDPAARSSGGAAERRDSWMGTGTGGGET